MIDDLEAGVAWELEPIGDGLERFVHEGHSPVGDEELVVVPSTEVVGFTDALLVVGRAICIGSLEASQQVVHISDVGVLVELLGITQSYLPIESGIEGARRDIVTHHIIPCDAIPPASEEALCPQPCLVEHVEVVPDLTSAGEGAVGGEYPLGTLIEVKAGGEAEA